VRRHAKAPSLRSRRRGATRRARLLLGFAAALSAALALPTAVPAATVQTHPYVGSLTPPGTATPEGPFLPVAMAINRASGNLYVVDAKNDVIDIFKPNGSFLGLIDGADTPEGRFFFEAGQSATMGSPIAIDNSGGEDEGRIYVDNYSQAHLPTSVANGLFGLSPTGSFLFWTRSGDGASGLAVDSHGSLFQAYPVGISGDIAFRVFSDPESGTPSDPESGFPAEVEVEGASGFGGASLSDIALDSQDRIYATTAGPSSLAAVERSGSVRWVARRNGPVNSVGVDQGTGDIYATERAENPGGGLVSRYDLDGSLQESFGLSLFPGDVRDVAIAEDTGTVYVADASAGAVKIFAPKSSATAPDATAGAVTDLAAEPSTGTGDLTVATGTGDLKGGDTLITNVTTDTGTFSVGESLSGDCCIVPGTTITAVGADTLTISPPANGGITGVSLVAASKIVTNFTPTSGTVDVGDAVYGSGIARGTLVTAVGGGTLTLSLPPTEGGTGVSLTTIDATVTLNGTVNPQGVPASWRFQYRRAKTRTWTATPLHAAGSGTSDVPVSEEISDLTQNTPYEFRLQTANSENGAIGTSSNLTTFTTPGLPQAILTIDPASSLTPTSAHLSGTVDPNGSDAKWHFEYTTDNSFEDNWTKVGADQTLSAGSGATPVSVDLSGLQPNTHYFARLIGANETGGPKASEEIEFTTPPAPPVVLAVAAGCLKPTSACLAGYVDPKNSATSYHFEYGTDESYGSSVPASQDGDAGAGFGSVQVGEQLSGLEPGTTYHFRLVADNVAGTTYGLDMLFQTRPDAAQRAQLEEGWPARGPELVNSPDKGNQAVYPFSKFEPTRSVSADGNHVVWLTANGGPESSLGFDSIFLATYTPGGWVSRNLLPPASELPNAGDDWYLPLDFSDDLSAFFYLSGRGLTGGAAVPRTLIGVYGQQARVLTSYSAEAAGVTGSPRENTRAANGGRFVTGGGSETPYGPFPLTLFDAEGNPHSISVPACGYSQISSESSASEGRERTWLNADASRIFITSAGDGDCAAPVGIYMIDVNAGTVTLVSGAQTAGTSFIRANRAGTELLFSKGGDLHRWRDGEGEECLSCGSGLTIGEGTASPDLSHLYFCGPPPPASPSSVNCSIYVWRERGISFVADRSQVVDRGFGLSPMQTSEDGNQLIFKSTRPLITSADPTGWNGGDATAGGARATQLYRYDDNTGIVECVSCADPPGGGLPGEEIFSANNAPAISADGQTIAFATDAKVLPGDINGRYDLYEWHDGLLRLVTDGESEFPNGFGGKPRVWGLSADGRSLIFSVGGVRLTGNEQDSVGNVYDGRVGGHGFPPPPPPASCAEDSCQGPLAAPPSLPGIATLTSSGPDNPPAKRPCRKGKVRRKGRCLARHHKHRRAAARANHKRGGGT
jgi:WD40 repeat protein